MVDSVPSRLTLECHSLDQLDEIAEKLISFNNRMKIWLFEGDMGAGKTTLIKAVCKRFHVLDTVSSPTFSIVNEYRNVKDEIFYHFDFYRIKDEWEALDIGVEEYFDSSDYCFIEWSSKINNLLPTQLAKIEITILNATDRLIEVTRYE